MNSSPVPIADFPHQVSLAVEERVVRELRADLESGWRAERNQELLDLNEIDLGGRLLIT